MFQRPADGKSLVVPYQVVILLTEGINLGKDKSLQAVDGWPPLQLTKEVSCAEKELGVINNGITSLLLPVLHLPMYTLMTASLAEIARTSHICAKWAGSLDAFSVYIASKSH
jgi:hypothetical protein